ncbi:MAG: nth [Microbacterium sp.]|nr:nth [Microbacterium sp.]
MPGLAAPLIAWYRDAARDLPWRREGFGAWGTLVSEFMLQQTPVNRVIPHLEAWLERWPTPSDLAASPPAEAVTRWANLGYPRRALWLHRAAVEIRDRHDGVVPRDVDALLALTGRSSRTGIGIRSSTPTPGACSPAPSKVTRNRARRTGAISNEWMPNSPPTSWKRRS